MATNVWNESPKIRPPKDGSYLVHLKQEAALKFGLGALPPIIVANFKMIDHQWKPNGCDNPIISFSENEVIEWHEIPPYSQKS